MKSIGILTSSRADYGIYLPLLRTLGNSENYKLNIIAFGTHMSPYHGFSVDEIKKDGFDVEYVVNSMLLNDDPNAIATVIGLTTIKFAELWKNHHSKFDIVFCLGDRYEMFAAVYAGIPFGIRFAPMPASIALFRDSILFTLSKIVASSSLLPAFLAFNDP